MDISIIIPVYNKENSIEKCVCSLLQPTKLAYEIIIVDDGSSDHSLDICTRLRQQYERVHLYVQENKGVSSARNLGLKNAIGDYVVFIDGDDYVKDDFWKFIEQALDVESDLSVFGMTRVSSNGEKHVDHFPLEIGEIYDISALFPAIFSLERCILSCCTMLFNRRIIEKQNLRFKDGMKNCEDFLFNLRYIDNCRTVFVSSGLSYCYVNNPQSVTMNRPLTHADDDDIIYGELLKFADKNNFELPNLFYRRWTRWMLDLVANWKEHNISSKLIKAKFCNNRVFNELSQVKSVSGVQWRLESFMLRHCMTRVIKIYIFMLNVIRKLREICVKF